MESRERLRERIPKSGRACGGCAGLSHVIMGRRYDPFWRVYLSVHVHFTHRTSNNSIYIPIHGTGNRSRWRARGPLSCTHSSRAWCQRRPPRQARVRLILLFFPNIFVDFPLSLSGSWVAILPRPLPASMALAPRLSKTMASQTLRRFSSKIPNIQCVFSGSRF